MAKKPRLKMINSSRYAKAATILITNEMKAIAEKTGVNVRLVIADKLKKTYIDNLTATYGPRSLQGIVSKENHKLKKSTYTNTHTLETAVNTVIEDKYVKIVIDENKTYDDARNVSVGKVYKWLREGTEGGSIKQGKDRGKFAGYYKDKDGEWHYNYPTPPHPFEEHTANEMKGFLESLASDVNKGKYTTYRYTGKKKQRRYYTYKG